MYMSDAEIIHSFVNARNRKEQLNILADLNMCTKEEMISKLKSLGVYDTPPAYDKRIEDMYKRGYTDRDISILLGISTHYVSKWRRAHNLTANRHLYEGSLWQRR